MNFEPQIDSPPATSELQQSLEEQLHAGPLSPCRIVSIHRRPSLYTSTYPLEELTLDLADGRRLELVFKDLSPHRAGSEASRAKPRFLVDPEREILCYQNLLSRLGGGTPTYHGSVVQPGAGRYWLFIEKVKGCELYQIGDFTVWKRAARWLAHFHALGAQGLWMDSAPALRLIRYESAYYGRWLERAMAISAARTREHNEQLEFLARLSECYPRVVAQLMALPVSITHGDFYSSNVIVRDLTDGPRICPIDWECAGVGPGLLDLAALTAGRWTAAQRAELEQEYFHVVQPAGLSPGSWDDFLCGLQLCRLHLAVQWLGWSADWSPPPEHRHDWLAEAMCATRALGIA
jgi:hypothetical protein